ncbi:MAG: cysteine--tRNA ligase [Gammaproteobacteria bacterium]|nr:cysteine--tRNA ligase [Gammaproteobacteria bacterium]
MLKIYNTLTRSKNELIPIEPGHVRMYVCGMTVYDHCHLGHARVFVVFDMVVRYLRACGLRVTYVRNITDIDDKIIARAREAGETIAQLTDRFIAAMNDDAAALRAQPPDGAPRATHHIGEILDMISILIERGHAYRADNGDVYYRVRSWPAYGRLSNRSLDDLLVGARVEADEAKEDPLDFVLWKAARPDEPSWDAPFGAGRPGWHIECSAMATHCLGNHFDIHGGGMDLTFPHHENEIAQSEAATGCHFANIWMHNGFVRINGEKMAKSLGNFLTIRDLLGEFDGEVLRYFLLASHYRSPLNYDRAAIVRAQEALTRLYQALKEVPEASAEPAGGPDIHEGSFRAAMDDDFNTPSALAVLFEVAHAIHRAREAGDAAEMARLGAILRRLGAMVGLLQGSPQAFLQGGGKDREAIEALIAARDAARRARQWARSDELRDELKARGVIVEDTAAGTVWRRA